MTSIDVQLRPAWVENVGYRYDVLLGDEVIVSRSRDPEYDAARELQALGLSGSFRTIDFFTGRHRMTLDIEKAARLRTIERAAGGPPTVGLYRPMAAEEKTRASIHRTRQGRVIPEGTAPDTRDAFQAAGGESGVARRRSRRATIHGDASLIPPEAPAEALLPAEHEEA